ncbi:hypothetical protein E3N88_09748 [Mikania micrantha]|uniref:CCHC-type domain-containing protein n=1 Tax=Mikania micrantha TaxID=192012 RepID=A0A5N6PKM0_9ASTR|nr:hypothetical protein E3N88_09748 [Mikania micrantha]
MGLDDVYQPVCTCLLTIDLLPTLKVAFSIISREESHRGTPGLQKGQNVGFMSKGNQFENKKNFYKGQNPNLKCTHCNKIGHTAERCFEIVGYPQGPKSKNSGQNNNQNNKSAMSNNYKGNKGETGTAPTLITEQINQLLGLINGKTNEGKIPSNFGVPDDDGGNVQLSPKSSITPRDKTLESSDTFENTVQHSESFISSEGTNNSQKLQESKFNSSEETDLGEQKVEKGPFEGTSDPHDNQRRSARIKSLPSHFEDFIIEGKVKYGNSLNEINEALGYFVEEMLRPSSGSVSVSRFCYLNQYGPFSGNWLPTLGPSELRSSFSPKPFDKNSLTRSENFRSLPSPKPSFSSSSDAGFVYGTGSSVRVKFGVEPGQMSHQYEIGGDLGVLYESLGDGIACTLNESLMGHSSEDATWEDALWVQGQFPDTSLEVKTFSEGAGIDTSDTIMNSKKKPERVFWNPVCKSDQRKRLRLGVIVGSRTSQRVFGFPIAVSIKQEASIETNRDLNEKTKRVKEDCGPEPEWMEWKERVTKEVLVPEKENECENPLSKLVLQAESKNDKVVGLCHNNEKLEEVRVVSPKCKPIKIQEVGVTQAKEGGKEVKDEDTQKVFKANIECARDKDKVMKMKEDDIYHKGRKPKFRDNGG